MTCKHKIITIISSKNLGSSFSYATLLTHTHTLTSTTFYILCQVHHNLHTPFVACPVKCSHAMSSVTFLNISSTTNEFFSDLQVAIHTRYMYWRETALILVPFHTPIYLVVGVGPLFQQGPNFAGIIILNCF